MNIYEMESELGFFVRAEKIGNRGIKLIFHSATERTVQVRNVIFGPQNRNNQTTPYVQPEAFAKCFLYKNRDEDSTCIFPPIGCRLDAFTFAKVAVWDENTKTEYVFFLSLNSLDDINYSVMHEYKN